MWLVVLDAAHFKVAARHDLAWIDTRQLAINVDAAYMVLWTIRLNFTGDFFCAALSWQQRIAGIAIQTNAGAVMIISDTP